MALRKNAAARTVERPACFCRSAGQPTRPVPLVLLHEPAVADLIGGENRQGGIGRALRPYV